MSIWKTKSGRWGVVIDLDRGADGKRRQKKLGTYRTQKLALEAERGALTDRGRGVDLSPVEITVTELVTRYIANRRIFGRGLKTLEEYEGTLRIYIAPRLGRVALTKLSRQMVSSWVEQLSAAGGVGGAALSPKTVRHAYGLLSAAITWGMTLELCARNVCKAVRPPSVPRTSVTALTEAEREALGDTAAESRWELFIAISQILGSRRGETLALNRSDVDFERCEVTISKALSQIKGRVFVKSTKTDRVRIVPVMAEALPLFRRQFAQQATDRLRAGEKYVSNLTDPDCPIFTDELGARLSPKAATNAYYLLAKKAGISSTKLHSSRHTAATMLIRLGIDPVTVSHILGHANPNVTLGVYGHLVPGAARAAMQLLSDELLAPRRKKPVQS